MQNPSVVIWICRFNLIDCALPVAIWLHFATYCFPWLGIGHDPPLLHGFPIVVCEGLRLILVVSSVILLFDIFWICCMRSTVHHGEPNMYEYSSRLAV